MGLEDGACISLGGQLRKYVLKTVGQTTLTPPRTHLLGPLPPGTWQVSGPLQLVRLQLAHVDPLLLGLQREILL